MQVNPRRTGAAVAILDLKGPLSRSEESHDLVFLISGFLDLGVTRILLNMREVTEVNSSGIETLFRCARLVSASGGRLRASEISRQLEACFCRLGLDSELTLYTNDFEAIAGFFAEGLAVAGLQKKEIARSLKNGMYSAGVCSRPNGASEWNGACNSTGR